jgi:nitrate/nitrite transport system substrate-binding protein
MKPEKYSLTLGFIPLTDCAPIVIAQELGYFAVEGLNVALSREASWATLRDKVTLGILDAAHMLAPMPIASTLGLSGFARPMVTALSLGVNGNAITVSSALYARMLEADFAAVVDPRLSARALKKVIEIDQREGRAPLTFAMVFPFSMHNYELRYWLASAGIDPENDIRLIVVPPPQMVANLRAGTIDGCCVGEPWNLLARAEGIGRTVVTGPDIWSTKPEKVLAVSKEWADRHPRTHQALLRALIRAARWLDDPVNGEHAAAILAAPGYIGVDAALIAASLPGAEQVDRAPDRNGRPVVNPSCFFASAATFPWRSHAMWMITQMYRWGQLDRAVDIAAVGASVYLGGLYREVAMQLGIDAPTVDVKTEGAHDAPWTLNEATQPIPMAPDTFMDGRRFEPLHCVDYLRSFDIGTVRADVDAVSTLNR